MELLKMNESGNVGANGLWRNIESDTFGMIDGQS